jgi:hypothetical protein
LGDLPTIKAAVLSARGDDPAEIEQPILGLREGVLAEGMFLLHKSAHVLGAAQIHIERGLCSWSLSSAYHAAFFGIKAILHFLGIVVIETGNQTYLVDIFFPPKKRIKSILGPHYWVQIQRTDRVEHRQMWHFLKRVFRVCNVPSPIWPVACVASILEHDINEFARQRNDLHYVTTSWPFPDLHACLIKDDFGRRVGGFDDGVAISDPSADDFSIALGLVILRMGCQMIADLADHAAVVRSEWNVLQNWLAGDCHGLYQAGYAAAT